MHLNKCPACGGVADMENMGGPRAYYAYCCVCSVAGPECGIRVEAADAWNRLVMAASVVEIDLERAFSYGNCPVRGAVYCHAVDDDGEHGLKWCGGTACPNAPDWCPLRKGPVAIRMKGEDSQE